MKILVIHTAFIGDMVLLTSHLKAIAEKYPSASLTVLTTKVSAELLGFSPVKINIIAYDKRNRDKGFFGFYKILKLVRQGKYDLVITPHRYLKSSVITIYSGAKTTVGYKKAPLSFLFSHRVEYKKSVHEIDRINELLNAVNIPNKFTVPELNVASVRVDEVQEWLGRNSGKSVVVAPGSVWFTKRYPIEQFADVVRLLIESGRKVILIGAKNENDLGDFILQSNLKNQENILNTIGKYKLIESAKIISLTDLVISNDSSPTHLSMAVGTPVITIFGATVPEFGFYPRGSKDQIIETTGLPCRPCGIHGGNKCPIGTFECMKLISPESIIEKVNRVLD